MYKDAARERQANRERQRRYRSRHKGVTSEGVTVKGVTAKVTPDIHTRATNDIESIPAQSFSPLKVGYVPPVNGV